MGYGIDPVAVFIDLLLLGVFVLFLGEALQWIAGQIKEHLGGDGHNIFQRIDDKAIHNRFFHGIAVKGAPELFTFGIAAELTKAGQGMIIGGGGKADNQILFRAGRGIGGAIKRALQFIENIHHLLMLFATVGTVNFIDQKNNAHFGQLL